MGIESSVLRCVGGQTTMGRNCHGENGRLSMVRCKICNVVEHCDKLFVLKFDGLCVGHQKGQVCTSQGACEGILHEF
jgi:hypothetical protein